MFVRWTVSEAPANLREVLDRVERGEDITITRHGRAVAVLLQPNAFRTRRAEQLIERSRVVAGLVAAGRGRPLSEAAVSAERAREWVEAVRVDRG